MTGLDYLRSVCAFVWRRLMFRTTFIAITGSVGKSTATASLGAILSAHYPTNWIPGARNNRWTINKAILRTRFHHRFTVIEVGTQVPGVLRRAAWLIAPDIVIMLRVLHLHSNHFPTAEAVAAEKAQLLSRLPRNGLMILNADDPLVMAMANRHRARVRTFGTTSGAFVTGSGVSSAWPQRLAFDVHCETESARVETQFVGEHMLGSALGALTAAVCCGVPLKPAAAVFRDVAPVQGRMAPMELANGVTVIRNEFNGTFPVFVASLSVMRQAHAQRRIVISGDTLDSGMNERARYHELGTLVAQSADVGIFLGDRANVSVRAAVEAGMNRESALAFKKLPDAANFLKSELRAGDLVLVNGWAGRHVERAILAQQGSISCWIEKCKKMIPCETCQELKLVPLVDTQGSVAKTRPG